MAVESAWVPDAIASRRAVRGVEMTQHPGALSSVNTLHANVRSLHVLAYLHQTEVFRERRNYDSEGKGQSHVVCCWKYFALLQQRILSCKIVSFT
jgi:hypothetical protein